MIVALAERPAATAIFVDYDGSLAPIVDGPDDAVALPAAIDALRQLVGRVGRVGVVSGRPVEFLARRVEVPGLVVAGLYGMETLVAGERRVDPRVVPYLGAVAAAADEAERRLPDVFVERKAGVSVTLHWRTVPDRGDEALAVAADLANSHGLATLRTRLAIELRPPVEIDKGTAVDALVAGYAVGAFAGDDSGDIAAFDALGRAAADGRLDRAIRIGVESTEMPEALPAAVDGLVDGPEGLADLLGAVAQRLS